MNQLLTEMDGVGSKKNVFVIGATNRCGGCVFVLGVFTLDGVLPTGRLSSSLHRG